MRNSLLMPTRKNVFLPLLPVFILTLSAAAQDRLSGRTFAGRSQVIARNGMAATNHPLASQIALDILKAGGSAVDAAIAASAFVGFADPAMNGIGGDMFAIVWSAKEKKLYGLNASGKSPAKLSADYFASNGIDHVPVHHFLAVTVPGIVDGWFQLHGRFGKLPFTELLEPTITYAREGIAVTQEIADLYQYFDAYMKPGNFRRYDLPEDFRWEDIPYFSSLYKKGGHFPREGDLFRNPDLAATLEKIARHGRDVFYKGEIADVIVRHMRSLGGFLTKEDFASHKSEWVDPVSVKYRDVTVWELPPHSQGIAALQMLNILEGFNFSGVEFGSLEHIHYLTEAKKLAFADLNKYCGDPDFSVIPTKELLSREYAEKRRAKILRDKAGEYGPGLEIQSHTNYLTVADKEGNMVSLIASNSWLFGSLVAPPGLGFVLQNRGSGFTLKKGHVNRYAPRKRPFHTIIPAFVTKDGKPFISFGLVGGDMQPQGHVQIVVNVVDFGMNLQEACDAPRIRHTGGTLYMESGFSYETIRELLKLGHQVQYGHNVFGGFQGILYDGTFYYGASDSRKDGQAVGY
jgi:gamma-glutamyltranspeptidase/glutathione hydrolase